MLADLDRRLRSVRRRRILAEMARWSAWALVWAGIAFVATSLAFRLGHIVALRPLAVSAAVLALGVLLALSIALRRAGSIDEAARYADDRLGMPTIFATALEVHATPAPTNPRAVALRWALLLEAKAATASVDPRRLVPLAPNWRRGLLVLLVVAAGVAVERIPQTSLAPTSLTVVPQVLTDADRTDLEGELERLADAVTVEAEHMRDPYLGAIGDAFRDLAERVAAGNIDASGLIGESGRLLSHLDQVSGARMPKVSASSGGDDSAVIEPQDFAVADAVPSNPSGAGPETAEELASTLRERSEALEEAAGQRRTTAGSLYFDSDALQASLQNQRSASAAQAAEVGEPVGAAQQSTDSPGDAAGAGSQPLDGSSTPDVSPFDTTQEVALPDAANPGAGSRVASLGEASDDAMGGVFGGGAGGEPVLDATSRTGRSDPSRQEAGGWRRGALGPEALAVARSLFAPTDTEGEP